MQQKMRDATVKHICLAHVYIEKGEKQSRGMKKHSIQIWGLLLCRISTVFQIINPLVEFANWLPNPNLPILGG